MAVKDARATVAQYLSGLRSARAVGVPETSYYGPLQQFLNSVGSQTTPTVAVVMHPKGSGAGLPDGGIFDAKQLSRSGGPSRAFAEQPATHGAIEAKPFSDDVHKIAKTRQVRKYLDRYGKVVVTNFWKFLVLTQAKNGQIVSGEEVLIAGDEEEFQALVTSTKIDPKTASDVVDALARILGAAAPIRRPQDLASHLASYARQALSRLEGEELEALGPLRDAFDRSLGVTFVGEAELRFFRSTIVQTLFYGAFSAWVLWSEKEQTADKDFDWRTAAWFTNIPVVASLFEHVAKAATLKPLKLDEVLDWAGEALNRVERDIFFENFDTGASVQYFYEPFLSEFDPLLRKELGVWYTPPEVVRYMVHNVHRRLQSEFGIDDGLADDRVVVLDPCTGTGSFLVETLRLIAAVRMAQTGDSFVGDELRQATLKRILGFEILPAPFVVAHLQINLLLEQMGASLGQEERARIYLTNALTGWHGSDTARASLFPDLVRERDAATEVKRNESILVVIGNPPYNAFAGVSPAEEGGLIDAYKEGLSEWDVGSKNSISDLYVRFVRVAERRIAETSGRGIVSLITNFGYLSDPTLVVLRQQILSKFDSIWIDNLNGDSRETGKKSPDGSSDPSIFAARGNPGIRTGTAIMTLCKVDQPSSPASDSLLFGTVRYREFWGKEKRTALLAAAENSYDSQYDMLTTLPDVAFALRPQVLDDRYSEWPTVAELSAVAPLAGLLEKRRGALFDDERTNLETRMRVYFDESVELEELPDSLRGVREPAAAFDPTRTRETLLPIGYSESKVSRYLARPFDLQWAYVEPTTALWNRARRQLIAASVAGSDFILVRRRTPKADDGAAFAYSTAIGDDHALHKDAYYIPLMVRPDRRVAPNDEQLGLFESQEESNGLIPNLSKRARDWLGGIGLDPLEDGHRVWLHVLAVGYTPRYLDTNRDAGRFTYHRIPLTQNKEQLYASSELGVRVRDALNTDVELAGVTKPGSATWQFYNTVARIMHPAEHGDTYVEGWASLQGDVVMPAAGTIEKREMTEQERTSRQVLEQTEEYLDEYLGKQVVDVYLNDSAYLSGVPENCWGYAVGGYTVLRKWLSYRDFQALGRGLTIAEIRTLASIARRLTLLLLLQPDLNSNYDEIVGAQRASN